MSNYTHIEELIKKFNKTKLKITNYNQPTSEAVLKMAEQEVVDMHNNWVKIKNSNAQYINECNAILKELIIEVDSFIGVFVHASIQKKNMRVKLLQGYVVPSFRDIPNYLIGNCGSGITVIEYWRKMKEKEKLDIEKSERVNKEFIKAVQIATVKYPDLLNACLGNLELVNAVTEKEKMEFESKVQEGTEYDCGGCDECGTWYYGSHRCDCGNRRVSFCIDGDLINGFYGYTECY